MIKVAIALGSNLGDRKAHLEFAIAQLTELLRDVRVSKFLDTEPVDVPDEQPRYLNAVVVGETDLEPEVLLGKLMAIELARGRRRETRNAARTLDLDIILYGNRIIHTQALEVPHPRFRDRDFVIKPLAELEPDWVDPVTNRSLSSLSSQRSQLAE